jgi:hypothetical protein
MKTARITTTMIPAATRAHIANLLGRTSIAFAILFGVALLIYIGLVSWLHHHISGQAISITQAAGLPADAERIFRGLLSWLLAFAALPAFGRLVLESLNPFRSTDVILGRLALLILLGLSITLLPFGLRRLRGVDHAGLPVRMEASDPARAMWWNPDGDPVLFFSTETGGAVRYWNRPGITPDTGLQAAPVTRDIRARYEEILHRTAEEAEHHRREIETLEAETTAAKLRADELAAKVEADRQERLRIEAETARLRREREAAELRAKQATEKAARETRARETEAAFARQVEQLNQRIAELKRLPQPAPVSKSPAPTNQRPSTTPSLPTRPAPSEWITRTLHPTGYLAARGVPNSRIEIRSDGHGIFHTPDGSPPQQFTGGHSSFHTSAPEFRLVGRERHSFKVSYRWIPQ